MFQPKLTQEQKDALERMEWQLSESEQEEPHVMKHAREEFGEKVLGLTWMTEGVWQIRLSVPVNGEHYVLYKVSEFTVARIPLM